MEYVYLLGSNFQGKKYTKLLLLRIASTAEESPNIQKRTVQCESVYWNRLDLADLMLPKRRSIGLLYINRFIRNQMIIMMIFLKFSQVALY